jgi:phage shock protein PspC (stress-responsive transcriptional regulator)
MKKLFRSKKDRILFGVCGGLAEYFEIDPIIVRLIFVILSIWAGTGILLYIVGVILIPEEGTSPEKHQEELKKKAKKAAKDIKEAAQTVAEEIKVETKRNPRNTGPKIAGLILIFLGFIFLAQAFMPWFEFSKLWPLLLVAIGLSLIAGVGRK